MKVENTVVEKEVIEEGTYNATCVAVIDMGTQKQVFQGNEKNNRMVSLTFEVADETDSEGNPFLLYKQYNLSVAPKSTLSKDLKSWMNVVVEKGESFDIDELLGRPALITVAHKEGESKTYVNIISISQPLKGTKIRKPTTALTGFYMADGFEKEVFDGLSQYMQGKIAESPEFKAHMEAIKSKPAKSSTRTAAKPTAAPVKGKKK